ncbi:MAG: hypothetical protein ACM37W_04665 [Actinomycetota bacterium]
MQPYSLDLRQKILDTYINNKRSQRQDRQTISSCLQLCSQTH